jgi:hypothetical protein
MNVGELRAALAEYPDDLSVAVIDGTYNGDDLDMGVAIGIAINHPDTRPHGRRSWRWKNSLDGENPGPGGDPVLVFY